METFIALFCIAPIIIYAVIIGSNAQKAWLTAQEKGRRIQLHNVKLREAEERRVHTAAVRDARIAEAHNKNQLLEMKIEQEAIKLAIMRREAGLDAPEFKPSDYDPDPKQS